MPKLNKIRNVACDCFHGPQLLSKSESVSGSGGVMTPPNWFQKQRVVELRQRIGPGRHAGIGAGVRIQQNRPRSGSHVFELGQLRYEPIQGPPGAAELPRQLITGPADPDPARIQVAEIPEKCAGTVGKPPVGPNAFGEIH